MREDADLPGRTVVAALAAVLAFAAFLVGIAALLTRPTVRAGRGLTPLVPLFDPGGPPSAAPRDAYGWVDRARGIVRIPVEDAIDLASEGRP